MRHFFAGLQKGAVLLLSSTISPLHLQKLEKQLTGCNFDTLKAWFAIHLRVLKFAVFSCELIMGFVSNAEDSDQIFVADAYVLKGMSELLDGKLMVHILLSC